MIIENSDALKVWLTSCLGRMCDADPAALAKYVLALVKKEKSETELREFCLDQLEVFLLKDTKHFVDLLFETLKTKSYLYKTDGNVPVSNTESLNNSVPLGSSKKLNSSEKADPEKDSSKAENVAKSKSSHFSSSRKHSKTSGRLSRENRDRNRSRSLSSSSHSSRSSSRERLKDKHKKEAPKSEERRRELPPDASSYSSHHLPYHLNNTKGSNRCKDYDEKGYCMQGDLCIYDHGADPVVLENVHGLNFGVTLGPHGPPNENSMVSAPPPLDITKSPLPPPPPTSPPPLPPPPPPLPPLPVATGPYMPEPYNPEAPAMNMTSPGDMSGYWMPPNMHIPSLHHSRPPPPLSGMSNASNMMPPQHNSKTMRSRELIGVPTVEDNNNKNISLKNISAMKKRKGFDYSRLGPKPKRMNFSCRTLELKCVPKHLNTISLLNSHFSKFGNVTNIEVFYNGDPEAALIQFQTPAQAALAHDSTDAVLNNRFIQVFWHNKEDKQQRGGKKEIPLHLKEVPANNFQANDVEKSRTFNAEKNTETKVPERSVVYSRGNICRTVYNPAVLKKVDPSATSLSLGTPKEDKKVNKKMELFKKKQEYLESQLRNQKIILEKLSSAKSEKEKAVLKEMLDNLAKSITECQQGLKDFIKQKTPTVVTKTEAEKMLLDAELDLYNTLNKCDGEAQQDTAELLLMKVNELKLKAKALGLKESAHEMGLKAKRRHLPFVPKSKQSLKIDNRPKTLCVAGTSERDVKKYFLQQLSDIEKIEERKPGCFIVTFKTRKAAETALSGSRLGNENVTVTWFRDNPRSTLEDLKESNVPKAKDDDNPNEAEGDEDEDEEEDSEARSWRR